MKVETIHSSLATSYYYSYRERGKEVHVQTNVAKQVETRMVSPIDEMVSQPVEDQKIRSNEQISMTVTENSLAVGGLLNVVA